MHKCFLIAVAASAVLSAQGLQRRAEMGRGPGGGEGCIVSVLVDGVADVEIRGDMATLHDISGAPPQFRTFSCSHPIPRDLPILFTAEAGRGRQEMMRQERGGGPVVVHIEDPQGGAGEYRFRLTWGGEMGDRRDTPPPPMDRDRDRDRGRDGDYAQERDRFFRGEEWRRNLFQRVRMDVEHVEHSTIPFTGDRMRLARTVGELNELQDKLTQHRYDERQLDDVIRTLRSVVDENRMSPADRDALSDDLSRLRQFRDRHEDYGARPPRN